MSKFWSYCLSQFEKELPAQQFITWIKPLSVHQNDAATLTIVAPNRFVLQWVRDKFFARLQSLAPVTIHRPWCGFAAGDQP